MPRALDNPFTVSIYQQVGSDAPGNNSWEHVCKCSYQIANGDLKEPPATHRNKTPDLTQSVANVCAAAAAAIKSSEGV